MKNSELLELFEDMLAELSALEERHKIDEARALFRLLNVCPPREAAESHSQAPPRQY